ncbi:MAG: excinuclease ABC subunit UvrA [Dermabacter sp.]|nr:excinuclease ABC subunit UvrA [Dermabacter sp.]
MRGARVNNLKGVSLDIPKRQLTVVTGVSGSGKSSLVFGTIAAESQRLINDTYSAFIQSFMQPIVRPDVEALENLTTAIVIDQEQMGANSRSTVGTATDASSLLRLLFSRLSTPYVGASGAFSFNLPGGMCPTCEGTGKASAINIDALVDRTKSLNDGALLAPGYGVDTWSWRPYAENPVLDADKVLGDYSDAEWHTLMYAEPSKVKVGDINMTTMGLVTKMRETVLNPERPPKQKHIQEFVARLATFDTCPECGGDRLAEAARTATVHGTTIGECSRMQVSDLQEWLGGIDDEAVAPLVRQLNAMLDSFIEVGLGYLSLDREAGTLSGGEAQRVKMIRHLGSALTDVTYVFDEPTVGLHPHDISRMNALLLQLRDKGNTVLVVEHKPEIMAIADLVVDIGPDAGERGGEIQFVGTFEQLLDTDTITARSLGDKMGLRDAVRTPTGAVEIRGAQTNNLRGVDVDVPTGVLTVVTGVAGSGKSSLVHGSLSERDGVSVVSQAAIRGSRRSNPATYTGLLDGIRTLFAKANGVKPAYFSANSEGACPECKGAGVITTDLSIVAGVSTPCEACEGKRFKPEVLQYRYRDLTIADVLDLPVDAAAEVFTGAKEKKILARLRDVGLGYIRLGQPLTTLSGGERQRLKLAARMADGTGMIVLDEPTTGLHLRDIENLVGMLHRLVESGNSLVVIEHNLGVIAQADWLIDVGPGAGHDGGLVVFEGTPQQMMDGADGLTADALRTWVAGAA